MSSRHEHESGSVWLTLAGMILALAGLMRIFDAIWAFRYSGALPENLEGAVFGTSLSTYGWIYLVVGTTLLGSSYAVLSRSLLARWIGLFAVGIMAISAMLWMPFYPVWSLTYIMLSMLVMYALAAHERTAKL